MAFGLPTIGQALALYTHFTPLFMELSPTIVLWGGQLWGLFSYLGYTCIVMILASTPFLSTISAFCLAMMGSAFNSATCTEVPRCNPPPHSVSLSKCLKQGIQTPGWMMFDGLSTKQADRIRFVY